MYLKTGMCSRHFKVSIVNVKGQLAPYQSQILTVDKNCNVGVVYVGTVYLKEWRVWADVTASLEAGCDIMCLETQCFQNVNGHSCTI